MGIIFPLQAAESGEEGVGRWRVKERRQIPGGIEENAHHTGKVTERQLRRKIRIQNQRGWAEGCSSKKVGVFLPPFPFKRNCFHLFACLIFKWLFKVQFYFELQVCCACDSNHLLWICTFSMNSSVSTFFFYLHIWKIVFKIKNSIDLHLGNFRKWKHNNAE